MKFKLADPGDTTTKWIMMTIMLILGVILVPIVVDQVQSTNTTGWSFTGHQGASTLFMLLPFIFIVGKRIPIWRSFPNRRVFHWKHSWKVELNALFHKRGVSLYSPFFHFDFYES